MAIAVARIQCGASHVLCEYCGRRACMRRYQFYPNDDCPAGAPLVRIVAIPERDTEYHNLRHFCSEACESAWRLSR